MKIKVKPNTATVIYSCGRKSLNIEKLTFCILLKYNYEIINNQYKHRSVHYWGGVSTQIFEWYI